MTYRDDVEAAEHRRQELEGRLRDIEASRASLRDLEAASREVRRELDECVRDLEARRARRALPLLDRLEIASPCSAKWEDMVGDGRIRFCASCEKNVYDISRMQRADAEALLRDASVAPCVRIFRRADGTVLTADCPVGRRRARIRRSAITTALAAGLLGVGLQLAAARGPKAPDPCPVAMGSVAMPEMAPPETTATPPAETGPSTPAIMGSAPPPHTGVSRIAPKTRGDLGMLEAAQTAVGAAPM